MSNVRETIEVVAIVWLTHVVALSVAGVVFGVAFLWG